MEFEATSDEAAIEEANLPYHDADDFHVEWDNTSNDRIVHVERIQRNGKHKTIAEDIDLKPNPLHDHAFASCKPPRLCRSGLGSWADGGILLDRTRIRHRQVRGPPIEFFAEFSGPTFFCERKSNVNPFDEDFRMYVSDEPAEPWGYDVDDYGISYGPGWWPWYRTGPDDKKPVPAGFA